MFQPRSLPRMTKLDDFNVMWIKIFNAGARSNDIFFDCEFHEHK